MDYKNKRALFIDLDSTLIKTASGKIFPEDFSDFRVQVPVLAKIVERMPMLNMLFIVSNQGGIKDPIDKRLFKFKINAIVGICKDYLDYRIMHFSFVDAMYCFSMDKDNPYRKPNTGMLEQLYNQYLVHSKDECIMIGDASGKPRDFSDSDKKCAENFGIDYIDVRDFLES